MAAIRILDSALADQIAAGEVVERPASVVKELVENALDAGALNITVEVEGTGTELLVVRDDGCGMSAKDARLAVQRHATSKLQALDDLERISTMGFRGEALPSIASVSKFELTTRTEGEHEGICVRVEGGGPAEVRPAGGPAGTRVQVRDLFFNVPARRKFLKTGATENAQVAQVLRRVALSHPAIRLRLLRGGRAALEFLPTQDIGQRVQEIFPKDAFTPLDERRGRVRLRAWLGAPANARSGAGSLYLFVNGRPVQDRGLAQAIRAGFGEELAGGRYPTGAAFVSIPPAEVDINVHPQKAEVRFAEALNLPSIITALVASTRAQAPQQRPPAPASKQRRGGAANRGPGFWKERLGVGPLVHGAKVGTATVVKQGRNREASSRRKPAPHTKPQATPATPEPRTDTPTPEPRTAATTPERRTATAATTPEPRTDTAEPRAAAPRRSPSKRSPPSSTPSAPRSRAADTPRQSKAASPPVPRAEPPSAAEPLAVGVAARIARKREQVAKALEQQATEIEADEPRAAAAIRHVAGQLRRGELAGSRLSD